MALPPFFFPVAIWAAYLGTGVGVVYLLAILWREWRKRQLW